MGWRVVPVGYMEGGGLRIANDTRWEWVTGVWIFYRECTDHKTIQYYRPIAHALAICA